MTDTSSHVTGADETDQAAKSHPAFRWRRSSRVDSLNIGVEEYEHRATGALHYHLDSESPENVFLVAFRTAPMDSTGVAHILEHTSLCGSARFPVRDPFFMMTRRSLNTFMNAFTSSDWTAYPFASKNRKDFNNLLQVYIDAAFSPNLHELDFAQEGHRLEFAEADDPNSELTIKGVVYNEMKGAMSSPVSVLWHTMCRYLFPETTYHFNSGGDPGEIPKLGYGQLLDFHRRHYHPGNSVFMTFGDIPAGDHQARFEEYALSAFEALETNVTIADESRYPAPVRVEERYYAEDENLERKTHVLLGWLLGRSSELEEQFRAQLLASVLLDNSASPLLKALESSDLGASPSPLCGLESSFREMSFMAGLEGCAPGATGQVEQLIVETLEQVAREGVPLEQVEAALHQLELDQREITGGSYPYGLQLILAGLPAAIHRGDPVAMLDLDPVLAKLREAIRDPGFIPGLARDLLLDNPHRVTLTLVPDPELEARRTAAEKRRLARIRDSLQQDEKARIIERSRLLEERQMRADDPEILPKVGLEDVPAEMSDPRRQTLRLPDGDAVSFYAQGTNGLAYQQIVFHLPRLEEDLLDCLQLYAACLGELGVGERDYAAVQTWQSRICGGIDSFSSIRAHLGDVQSNHALFTVSSRCLIDKHSELADLMHATIRELRFDEGRRLKELVEQIMARKENSITSQGHNLAMSLACSRMSPAAQLAHNTSGLESIRRLRELAHDMPETEAQQGLLARFAHLHRQIVDSERQFLLIAEPEHRDRLLNELAATWSGAAKSGADGKLALPSLRERACEAWTTATSVNFCAKAWPTVPGDHEDNPVLHVLGRFINNGFLHRAIREQGGAYGSGAGQNSNTAVFRCFSYRDPRLNETLGDFDRALDWVLQGKHKESQLEEAILGVIASMDKPSSPAGEAKIAFYDNLFGRSLEQRLVFRKRALATTLADLRTVTERYFNSDAASYGLITSREAANSLQLKDLRVVNL
ncbi:MAG: peptidase M16 [Gammaproteobacteria bacterium]|nr:peptidase M16 [Gammaproteobacteria bacterium]MYC59975.1 peptidase M16 [Gammaproteobacteria bacterium]MYH86264.1 peptidase M16 [Gammaproteobacteria bacterium]MYK03998.1 peptidase M16 [Gammaproteobacteria bacterium]